MFDQSGDCSKLSGIVQTKMKPREVKKFTECLIVCEPNIVNRCMT